MLRNLIASLVFGLLAFSFSSTWFSNTVQADTTTTAPTSGAPAKKKTVLSQLRKAHELLTSADHDYDGHRAKAAEEVHHAITEIMGKRATKAAAKKTGKSEAHHEVQGKSDEQLTAALKILQGVQSEVTSKHPKVSTNIGNAISELNTALKLK